MRQRDAELRVDVHDEPRAVEAGRRRRAAPEIRDAEVAERDRRGLRVAGTRRRDRRSGGRGDRSGRRRREWRSTTAARRGTVGVVARPAPWRLRCACGVRPAGALFVRRAGRVPRSGGGLPCGLFACSVSTCGLHRGKQALVLIEQLAIRVRSRSRCSNATVRRRTTAAATRAACAYRLRAAVACSVSFLSAAATARAASTRSRISETLVLPSRMPRVVVLVVTALVQRPQPRGDVRDRDAALPLRRAQAAAVDNKLAPGDVQLVARAVPRFDAGFEALVERVHLREHRVCLGALWRRRSLGDAARGRPQPARQPTPHRNRQVSSS